LFLITAASLAVLDAPAGHREWFLAPLFVITIALASRVELEVGSGFASPVVLVVIPMLFALPAGHVPVAVALGLVLGQLPAYIRGRVPTERIIVAIGNASYTLAPAIVFMLFYRERTQGPANGQQSQPLPSEPNSSAMLGSQSSANTSPLVSNRAHSSGRSDGSSSSTRALRPLASRQALPGRFGRRRISCRSRFCC
jgi:hypothetical protein